MLLIMYNYVLFRFKFLFLHGIVYSDNKFTPYTKYPCIRPQHKSIKCDTRIIKVVRPVYIVLYCALFFSAQTCEVLGKI